MAFLFIISSQTIAFGDSPYNLPSPASLSNIEAIAAGGGACDCFNISTRGGGGGAYAETGLYTLLPNDLTTGITFTVGAAGIAAVIGSSGQGTDGGNCTVVNSVSTTILDVGGGKGHTAGSIGGSVVVGTGFSGGSSGNSASTGGGGGGGAAGPSGIGGNSGAAAPNNGGGGGGGADGLGSAPIINVADDSGGPGGGVGAGLGGTPGFPGGDGSGGGGGGGGGGTRDGTTLAAIGGASSASLIHWDGIHGPGSGAGGGGGVSNTPQAASPGGLGVGYGQGGGQGGFANSGTSNCAQGSNGGPGLIVVTFTSLIPVWLYTV